MKLKATLGGYSSIVGQSIMLHDETGKVVCQLAMLNIGAEGHKQKSEKFGQFVTDRINGQPTPDYTSTEVRALAHMMAKWVKTADRQPTVGGSYITGDYVEDGTLPRRFDRSRNRYVIFLNTGPQWRELEEDIHGRTIDRDIDPPEYWLENLPPHPEHKA